MSNGWHLCHCQHIGLMSFWFQPISVQDIPRIMHTVCFVVVCSGLLLADFTHIFQGYTKILSLVWWCDCPNVSTVKNIGITMGSMKTTLQLCPVPVRKPWRIWVNVWQESTKKNNKFGKRQAQQICTENHKLLWCHHLQQSWHHGKNQGMARRHDANFVVMVAWQAVIRQRLVQPVTTYLASLQL